MSLAPRERVDQQHIRDAIGVVYHLSEFGEPEPHAPDDFAAWMEVWLAGGWRVFDPRNNAPRIGRVLISRGRDAADAPLTLTFGPNTLTGFSVWAT